MEKGISVIICCYNSGKRIEETLKHLKKQAIEKLPAWEIILVDNNCTDDTVDKALTTWNNHNNIPLHIVKEPSPGQMKARIAGVNFAHFSYSVFCDDDNHLYNDYLEKAFAIMSSDDRIGIAGGITEGVFEETPPDWFPFLQHSYAVGAQGTVTGDISFSRGYVWGAGMVVQTEKLRKIFRQGFISLGRKGKGLASGDDTEMCFRMAGEGLKIMYLPELKLKHFITKNRLTWNYAVELGKGQTVAVINLADLKRKNIERKEPEPLNKKYKDLLYLAFKSAKPSLRQMQKTLNLKKHEGNMELWDKYFGLYFLYMFFRIKILKHRI